jgi:rod shape-determining protein MreB
MAVRLGAGRAEAQVYSLGRVIGRARLPFGASRIDEGIIRLLRERMGLSVGPRTAEELKVQLSSAIPGRALTADAAGLDGAVGFPKVKQVPAELVREAVMPLADALADMALRAMDGLPGQAVTDLIECGMTLVGGGALIFGLSDFLAARTGIPCHVPADPAGCAALGLNVALEDEVYAKLIEAA